MRAAEIPPPPRALRELQTAVTSSGTLLRTRVQPVPFQNTPGISGTRKLVPLDCARLEIHEVVPRKFYESTLGTTFFMRQT